MLCVHCLSLEYLYPKEWNLKKERLTSTPVLTLPEGTKVFIVYCHASWVGLGFILMQHGKVVAYCYRQHKVHEKNYPTHYLELAAVVLSLKIESHYLYVCMLICIHTTRVFNMRLLKNSWRWVQLLQNYDMSILDHPDKANVVVDALSRTTIGSVVKSQNRLR